MLKAINRRINNAGSDRIIGFCHITISRMRWRSINASINKPGRTLCVQSFCKPRAAVTSSIATIPKYLIFKSSFKKQDRKNSNTCGNNKKSYQRWLSIKEMNSQKRTDRNHENPSNELPPHFFFRNFKLFNHKTLSSFLLVILPFFAHLSFADTTSVTDQKMAAINNNLDDGITQMHKANVDFKKAACLEEEAKKIDADPEAADREFTQKFTEDLIEKLGKVNATAMIAATNTQEGYEALQPYIQAFERKEIAMGVMKCQLLAEIQVAAQEQAKAKAYREKIKTKSA